MVNADLQGFFCCGGGALRVTGAGLDSGTPDGAGWVVGGGGLCVWLVVAVGARGATGAGGTSPMGTGGGAGACRSSPNDRRATPTPTAATVAMSITPKMAKSVALLRG